VKFRNSWKRIGTVTSRKRRCGWFDGVYSEANNIKFQELMVLP
jgi:adenylosuccinate synthase